MASRTPIRLTPYRGPLATPSTSAESSPTLSTPPTDISHCSTATRPALDVAILHHRISALGPLTRRQHESRLHRRKRQVTRQGLFGRSTHRSPFSPTLESLLCLTSELAKALAGIVTFCLFIWGLLEWSSYASELPRRPGPSISLSRFPLPSPTRVPRCHVNPSLCGPGDQHAAVLQFLSEQVQHAKALSSLSTGLGLPLRTFFEVHRATVSKVIATQSPAELPHAREGETLANLTELFDASLLDFTSGSFIGRSFSLALEGLSDLVSEPILSRGPLAHGDHQDAHLHAIYWRTASNLLLEYSAARPRASRLLRHLHALHQRSSSLASGHHIAGNFQGRLNIWRWKSAVLHPAASIEDETQAFATGLEVTLDNVRRLIAYLDWITQQLAQTTLRDVLKMQHKTDFSSCMMSLQELFARSKPPTPKKLCSSLDDYEVILPNRLERVEVVVPGSPTVHAER